MFGTVAYSRDKRPLNSAVLLGDRGQLLGRYDKIFLVPFGEFVPPGFGWIEQISGEAGMYESGRDIKVFQVRDRQGRGHSLGTIICYESAFPHLVRQFPANGAEVIVNLTNDGYFGRSSTPRNQHLLLARMRAVENARWILRPANDGISASIDPAGGVHDRQQEFARQAGRLRFDWRSEKTLYTRYGDWFAWSCLIAGAALSVLPARISAS
jgi:apolipoprotein N-acyltransferase